MKHKNVNSYPLAGAGICYHANFYAWLWFQAGR